MYYIFSASSAHFPIPTNPSQFTQNPVVHSTLRIWYQFRGHFEFTSPSTLTPVLRNHLFKPSLSDSSFSVWHEKGLKSFKNLYKNNVFCSFTELSARFRLPITVGFEHVTCASPMNNVYDSQVIAHGFLASVVLYLFTAQCTGK